MSRAKGIPKKRNLVHSKAGKYKDYISKYNKLTKEQKIGFIRGVRRVIKSTIANKNKGMPKEVSNLGLDEVVMKLGTLISTSERMRHEIAIPLALVALKHLKKNPTYSLGCVFDSEKKISSLIYPGAGKGGAAALREIGEATDKMALIDKKFPSLAKTIKAERKPESLTNTDKNTNILQYYIKKYTAM